MQNDGLWQNSSDQNYGCEFASLHPSLLHKQQKGKREAFNDAQKLEMSWLNFNVHTKSSSLKTLQRKCFSLWGNQTQMMLTMSKVNRAYENWIRFIYILNIESCCYIIINILLHCFCCVFETKSNDLYIFWTLFFSLFSAHKVVTEQRDSIIHELFHKAC